MNVKSEKRKRFEKVAGGRVNTILKTLDSLDKCSNKNNYEYTEADIRKMKSALINKLNEVMRSFSNTKGAKKDDEFKF
ncbi:hypothetical protein [Reichenbachiella sp.]|uniref:hypothetical protein n=1 Tax=Reichenbachiella sp. TaxID=2184521 RepID=UPI003298B173